MIWKSGSTLAQREDIEERNRVSSYRGYLFKLRRSKNLLAPQWGKRWITIEGHFLKWYRQETDLSPSGMIDLKYIRSIHKLDSGPAWTFVITCEERTLVLRCSSKNEMNSWIRALHIQADIARGGTGMMVVSDFNQIPLDFSVVKYGGPKSNKKSSPKLTLEQELDLTLKKLQELEQKAQTPEVPEGQSPDFVEEDITNNPPINLNPSYGRRGSDIEEKGGFPASPLRGTRDISAGRIDSSLRELSGAPRDPLTLRDTSRLRESKEAPLDGGGGRVASVRTSRYGSPRAASRSSSPRPRTVINDDDPLEDSSGSLTEVPVRVPKSRAYMNPLPAQPSSDKVINRTESNNSIEDISLDTNNARVSRARNIQQQRANSNGRRGSRTFDAQARSGLQNDFYSHSREDTYNDEFDISDSSPPQGNRFNVEPVDKRHDFDYASESVDFLEDNSARSLPLQNNLPVRTIGRHHVRVVESDFKNGRNIADFPRSPQRLQASGRQTSLRSAWDNA